MPDEDAVRPTRILVIANVAKEDEGDVMVIRGCIDDAGVEADFAYEIFDLQVSLRGRECEVAVIDLSFPSAAAEVARILDGVSDPPLLASMKFFKRVTVDPPSWAFRHIVYGEAKHFARDLLALAHHYDRHGPGR